MVAKGQANSEAERTMSAWGKLMARILKTDAKSVARRERYAAKKAGNVPATGQTPKTQTPNPVEMINPIKALAEIKQMEADYSAGRKSREELLPEIDKIIDQLDVALGDKPGTTRAQLDADRPKPSKHSTWGDDQIFKLKGRHHRIGEEEAGDICEAVGGIEYVDATGGMRMVFVGKGGTFCIDTGHFPPTLDGYAIDAVDFLAVGETAYDMRFLSSPGTMEKSEDLPDDVFLGGMRIVKTVPKVQLDKIRDVLQEHGIETRIPLTPLQKARAKVNDAVKHVSQCPCPTCAADVAKAKQENRPLEEVIADTQPGMRRLLDTIKEGAVLNPIVEDIKRAALEGTDVDPKTAEKVRQALKRSTVIVPEKVTVN